MQAPSIEESLKAPSFVTRLAFTLTNVWLVVGHMCSV